MGTIKVVSSLLVLLLMVGCQHDVAPFMDFFVSNSDSIHNVACPGGLKVKLEVGNTLKLESPLVESGKEYSLHKIDLPKDVHDGVPVKLEAWCYDVDENVKTGYILIESFWKGIYVNTTTIISPLDYKPNSCRKGSVEIEPVPCVHRAPFSR